MQLEEVEKLERRLKEPLSTPERVDILIVLADEFYSRDPVHGADLAREALDLARSSHNPRQEAQALHYLGTHFSAQADYAAALETQNEALSKFRALNDKAGEGRCLRALGIVQDHLADHGQALDLYEQSLKLFRELGDVDSQALVIANIANIEVQLGNFDSALELFDVALQIRRARPDDKRTAIDLNNAAVAHVQKALRLRQQGDVEHCQKEAEIGARMANRAVFIARRDANRRLEAFCMETLAEAYNAMAKPEIALDMANQFLALADESNDRWVKAHGIALIGEIRHQLGEHQVAIKLLQDALATFDATSSHSESGRICEILSKAYEATGNVAEALKYLRRHNDIKQKLRNEEVDRQARALTARRRLEHAGSETEHYKRLAMEDSLTGLANRRQIDSSLEEMLAEAEANNWMITVALADLDHFKAINDQLSHAIGDDVLRHLGDILRTHCRSKDLVGRYGGEEFVLVFRDMDMKMAREICERVRHAVETYDWSAIHPQLRVTLSIGLASSEFFRKPQQLLDNADHWLYEAKRLGRNLVQPVVA